MPLPRRFYNTRHENNVIIVSARKGFTFYTDTDIDINNNNLPRNPEYAPWVFIVCELFHRVIANQDQEVLHEEHVTMSEFCSHYELFATAEESRSSIDNLFSRTKMPFDLEGNGDRLRWKDQVRRSFDETDTVALCGLDDVAARVSAMAESFAAEARSSARPVTSVELKISFSELTFVDAEVFAAIDEDEDVVSFSDDDDEGNVVTLGREFSRPEWSSMESDIYDDDDDVAMVGDDDIDSSNHRTIHVVFETVVYGGDATELTCAICRDDVDVGTHVAMLACGHKFHGDCIDPWLKRKTTCPSCRLELAK